MVCDANSSDESSFFLEEETALVGVQLSSDQINPSIDIPCNIPHLSEEWMQCQDSQ
jgi:hypothetical protein